MPSTEGCQSGNKRRGEWGYVSRGVGDAVTGEGARCVPLRASPYGGLPCQRVDAVCARRRRREWMAAPLKCRLGQIYWIRQRFVTSGHASRHVLTREMHRGCRVSRGSCAPWRVQRFPAAQRRVFAWQPRPAVDMDSGQRRAMQQREKRRGTQHHWIDAGSHVLGPHYATHVGAGAKRGQHGGITPGRRGFPAWFLDMETR